MSKNRKSIYSSLLNNKIDMISNPNGFTNWLHKEIKLQQQKKSITTTTKGKYND